MIDVFLLLGSNLGNRNAFLHKAIEYIEQDIAPVIKKSAVYETQSWGKTDLPDYLNQVVMLQTALPAQDVLQKLLTIEIEMGRKREEKWGSRIIDIDILFYGNEIINEPNLIVPHPELHNRRFTLEPLGMLMPDFIHPVLNKSILDLKSSLKDDLIVKKI
ncbi:2-amino-4-hydroxy-6-hydroxymethyldihydropteridine diphosphokinase [Mucilaginibacter rigui]|uniref:2-amino-4-hydroxy-6-hydroxymethyldihydropteridine pyrophosphokinase n=1 Tax=Mucilaginibacter rigui TaxID=534635 RepID=A0ABR7X887_9SPHI|nr:2-amino-4-hydroxy-6-hydroxymethyldihydropteridine diphosphokinase [Mucilaginibacter rigui]MBD1386345.1 2-amino-4-hydroxy-6-hydroxymethyldihydropteridine diphosphokinase [Mucilaginibacter rigui]